MKKRAATRRGRPAGKGGLKETGPLYNRVVSFMMDKASYPEKTRALEHIETHISHVFLTDRFAYKIKKQVDFGFLDFTTLKKRKFFCSEELRLNRRMSKGLYLSVVAISESSGRLKLGGRGKPVEYAVKMRRVRPGCSMTSLVTAGKVGEREINTIARMIAEFHLAEQRRKVTSYSRFASWAIRETKKAIEQNFSQTEKYIGKLITKADFGFIKRASAQFFSNYRKLLRKRIEQHKIIEIHGDLHTGNIFIESGRMSVFDCIEFNRAFRTGDAVSDIAFLAMDLDYLGREDLSKFLVRKYIEYTKDHKAYLLLKFYKCYRAYVRAKVASFMLDNRSLPKNERAKAGRTAKKYYSLALEYAKSFSSLSPVLIISCGLSGTGKSRWLKFASDIMGGEMLVTDQLRRELFGLTGKEKKNAAYMKKYYSEKMRQLVYDYIFGRAGKKLSEGRNIAIDASFISRKNRDTARKIARKNKARFVLIYTTASESLIRKRMLMRMKSRNNISDADFKHAYLYQKSVFEKPGPSEDFIHINTDIPDRVNLKFLKEQLKSCIKPRVND